MQSSNEKKNVGIIGAGLGGLAAACTLAARGHSVTLLERNEWAGGKAAVLEMGGYRFDMGPTILTVPSVLRRIFAEAGQRIEDSLDLIPLDPQWRCFFNEGQVLDLWADREKMQAAVCRSAGEAAWDGYEAFLRLAGSLHTISEKYFFWKPVGSIRDTFDANTTFRLSTLRELSSMRMGQTVSGAIRSFVKDPNLSQMLDHYTQYIGSAPDQSPAILCAIAHMQNSEGVWYPQGGTGALARAMLQLARNLGVRVRLRTGVSAIHTVDGSVRGVTTDLGESLAFDAVVANSDIVRSHRELIQDRKTSQRFERRRAYEPACSGVVLYLGLTERYEQLLHHNFVFSRDPEEEFDHIYRKGELAPDPTCYVCAPAITDPSVAPRGKEALYVLVHTPYLRAHHNWRSLLPDYRKVILEKLARTAGLTDLESRIEHESALTPQDINDRYSVLNGAIYGLASHGRFTGAFKPSNRSADVSGLYFAGGSAHPGPGMPMVMMSGWIAADALDRDASSSLRATGHLETTSPLQGHGG
jgi:diapolycopene oxygenase